MPQNKGAYQRRGGTSIHAAVFFLFFCLFFVGGGGSVFDDNNDDNAHSATQFGPVHTGRKCAKFAALCVNYPISNTGLTICISVNFVQCEQGIHTGEKLEFVPN